MISTTSDKEYAYVTVDIAGKPVSFCRASANETDAAVIAAAAKAAIKADQGDMVNRYNERTQDYYSAMRRISALKARITKLKRGKK